MALGWEMHVLEVEFRGGRRYQFGGVPEEVKAKLLRSPFPDHLFQQIVRGKYVSARIDNLPPSKRVEPFLFDPDTLPF